MDNSYINVVVIESHESTIEKLSNLFLSKYFMELFPGHDVPETEDDLVDKLRCDLNYEDNVSIITIDTYDGPIKSKWILDSLDDFRKIDKAFYIENEYSNDCISEYGRISYNTFGKVEAVFGSELERMNSK